MTYLREDKELFREVIAEVNAQTGVAQSIIEKDYYVTMILKLLSERLPKVVFKGGTSLSKCFHLIDRFSEDIDVTFTEHIGASRKKKLKYDVLKPIMTVPEAGPWSDDAHVVMLLKEQIIRNIRV